MVVPATSSNTNLCKLLLSAAVLDYPEPVLVNWGAEEDDNSYIQHLAKVGKVLDYLQTLPSAAAEDLVLVVDGYDVWFQLPPDVLIQRYYAVTEAANHRLRLCYHTAVLQSKNIRQTVLFGPDKLCWPDGDTGERPACWAVPQSTLPANAFGSSVEQTSDPVHQRPRWLNSGTLIGPVAEVQAVYQATAKSIRTNHTTDSDQFYFATLFGAQEYARRHLQKNPLPDPEGSTAPLLGTGQKTEYHMGIDYEYALFQNLGYSTHDVAWMLYNNSQATGLVNNLQVREGHRFDLPNDITSSPSPFSLLLQSGNVTDEMSPQVYGDIPVRHRWKNVPLATNVVTNQVPVLLHFTLDKELRDEWWNRMWFYPYGQELLKASFDRSRAPFEGNAAANAGDGEGGSDRRHASKGNKREGAWSDQGDWIAWEVLCKIHEPLLFGER